MNHNRAILELRQRRRFRVRKRLHGTAERPRLTVFRSHKHIYAQLIDDDAGRTVCSASTRDKDLAGQLKYGGNKTAAELIGKTLAERAKAVGVTLAAFDRGGCKFHGRVAALAAGARAGGLGF